MKLSGTAVFGPGCRRIPISSISLAEGAASERAGASLLMGAIKAD